MAAGLAAKGAPRATAEATVRGASPGIAHPPRRGAGLRRLRDVVPKSALGPPVLDDLSEDVREVLRRPPTQQPVQLPDVGNAGGNVLETLFIGLVIGHEHDLGARAGGVADALRELPDRDLLRAAYGELVAIGVFSLHQSHHRLHDVADVAEAAALGAVAEDRDRLARQRLADEARDDHPVAPGLPRPDGVEEAA